MKVINKNSNSIKICVAMIFMALCQGLLPHIIKNLNANFWFVAISFAITLYCTFFISTHLNDWVLGKITCLLLLIIFVPSRISACINAFICQDFIIFLVRIIKDLRSGKGFVEIFKTAPDVTITLLMVVAGLVQGVLLSFDLALLFFVIGASVPILIAVFVSVHPKNWIFGITEFCLFFLFYCYWSTTADSWGFIAAIFFLPFIVLYYVFAIFCVWAIKRIVHKRKKEKLCNVKDLKAELAEVNRENSELKEKLKSYEQNSEPSDKTLM